MRFEAGGGNSRSHAAARLVHITFRIQRKFDEGRLKVNVCWRGPWLMLGKSVQRVFELECNLRVSHGHFRIDLTPDAG
jgi:hypothetical protein